MNDHLVCLALGLVACWIVGFFANVIGQRDEARRAYFDAKRLREELEP